MKFSRFVGKTLLIIFALVGFVFSGVFFGMKMGWTNVRGTIAERNASFFKNISKSSDTENDTGQAVILCKIHALANFAPGTAKNIQTAYETKQDPVLAGQMLNSASDHFFNTTLVSTFNDCARATVPDMTPIAQTAYVWADSPEWEVIKSAFIRDQDTIRKASKDAGISPRILLGGVIGEQLRFFTSSRDSFKSYFEPLKILAPLSSFSFGIAGLKPATVASIDENLLNVDSDYYLGANMENIINYPDGADEETVRFERITDTKNTYYSYLYVGLFMRQIMAQWQKAGYDISNRPDILSTLYNFGFYKSVPKPDPQSGGAIITINGQEYNFGQLGGEFYYSGELVHEFPY